MQHGNRIFKASGPVLNHRGNLRALFDQVSIFLRNAVQLCHSTGQLCQACRLL